MTVYFKAFDLPKRRTFIPKLFVWHLLKKKYQNKIEPGRLFVELCAASKEVLVLTRERGQSESSAQVNNFDIFLDRLG